MAIRIVRLGSARHAGEGVRFGTVRRPPRGVAKSQHASQNWYDVWLPTLAPTANLLLQAPAVKDGSRWRRFLSRFTAEMRKGDARHVLDALAALSQTADFSIGCYCENEAQCHRSVLRRELERRGAAILPSSSS